MDPFKQALLRHNQKDCNFNIIFFLRDFIFKKTLFEKLEKLISYPGATRCICLFQDGILHQVVVCFKLQFISYGCESHTLYFLVVQRLQFKKKIEVQGIFNPFPPSAPIWDRLGKLSILILEGITKKNFL